MDAPCVPPFGLDILALHRRDARHRQEEPAMPEGMMKTRKRLLADEPSPPSHYIDVVGAPWETSKFLGIEHKVLHSDPNTGMATLLLAPGTVVPLHEHTGVKLTHVLEGSLDDEEGVCTTGNFVWRPAGKHT
jgi:anti-sigma factor ChrR (cupin superfamily)